PGDLRRDWTALTRRTVACIQRGRLLRRVARTASANRPAVPRRNRKLPAVALRVGVRHDYQWPLRTDNGRCVSAAAEDHSPTLVRCTTVRRYCRRRFHAHAGRTGDLQGRGRDRTDALP